MELTSEQQYSIMKILCEIASRNSDVQWSPVRKERSLNGSDHKGTAHSSL